MAQDTIDSSHLGGVLNEQPSDKQGDQICEEKVLERTLNQSKAGEQMTFQQSDADDQVQRAEKDIALDRIQPSEYATQQLTEGHQGSEQEYSVFSKNEKRFIVITATMAAAFSPISTNIFFPALNVLASDLHVSDSLINLTVTSYMVCTTPVNIGKVTKPVVQILQGIAPTFIGSFSDAAGRRPAYLACFVIYLGANIGLALQTNYAALLVLRMIQSAGSSGTVALTSGVVADIATRQERGKYTGYTSAAIILGPTLGPVIGGILANRLGWRSIFWFLTIFAGAVFVPLLIFFPETSRKVVGNGSTAPKGWNMSVLNYHHMRKRAREGPPPGEQGHQALPSKRRVPFPNPIPSLRIAFEKEAATILFSAGLLYAGFYMVTAAIPSQFQEIYGFNDLQIGLCFIPLGVGATIAAFTRGKTADWNYRRHANKLGISLTNNRQHDIRNFPIETVRLQVALPFLYLAAFAIIALGWVLEFETNLAGPLILLFFIGYNFLAAFNVMGVLVIDIYRESPATASAANNLIRCLLGAGGTALVIPMINAMGRGWTYTFIGLVCIALTPVFFVVMRCGPGWREERRLREEKKKAKHAEVRQEIQAERGQISVALTEEKPKEVK